MELVMRRLRDCSGAAYVEFLIAIVPMLVFFWSILQVNGLLLADLVVRHAAVNAVRAAVVCDSDAPGSGPETEEAAQSNANACANLAAQWTIGAVKSIQDVTVAVKNARREGNAPVTATATAHYSCQVPLVGALACRLAGSAATGPSVVTIQRQATLPNQGAYYKFTDQKIADQKVN
jgi:Flp pilus assembly protein TadG